MADNSLVIWLTLVCFSFLLTIVQIYGLRSFQALRHLVIVQKRYPNLVFAKSIVSIFLTVVAFPM